MVSAPSVRRRLVGRALRQYRENLGYTLDEPARILECDRSKVSRIETGQRGIRGKELRELLTEYGVTDEQRAILTTLADPRGAFGWHRDYTDALPGAWKDYLVLETAASKIAAYEAQRIPALLQTPAYARELAEADPGLTSSDARARSVEAVLARQHAIRVDHRPEIDMIIGEAALRQEVGGPEVMKRQLAALAKISANSGTIAMQILPFSSGAHAAAAAGSLAILHFAEAPELGLVHLGGATGGVCLESPADVAAHARVFEQLRAFALSPADSALHLRGLANA